MEEYYEKYIERMRKLFYSVFAFDIHYYCPKCYNKKFLVPDKTENLICSECDWEGPRSDCLSEGEYKNKLRTELIDKML